jgi:tRNA (guanine-N7-)-methyltransferase
VSEPLELATAAGIGRFAGAGDPGALDGLVAGRGAWEAELGFGKGRFLLARAAAHPERRFLGVELAREYFRLAAGRLARRGLANVALLRGEALAILATALPRAFAAAIHVYFPDPWPKSRHHRRRLFSPASIDLLAGALASGGELCFATDHLDYGAEVRRLLAAYPGAELEEPDAGWPEGPRTNYEAKYVAAGRPILRLVLRVGGARGPHPEALRDLVAAVCGPAAGRPSEPPEPGA